MGDKPLDVNPKDAMARRGWQSLFSRSKDRTHGGSQADSLRPVSNPGSSSQPSVREKSPDREIKRSEKANLTVSVRNLSAAPGAKVEDDEDAQSSANAVTPGRIVDFWTIAEAELLKDSQKREKLDKYNLILEKRLGSKLEPSGTPERRKHILDFLHKAVDKLNSADSQTRLSKFKRKASRFFKSTIDFVVATQSTINTAASPCLPASVACAGVTVLLSVSTQTDSVGSDTECTPALY